MSDVVAVVVNGELTLRYERELPAQQREYLERMDRRMDGGIALDGETIANPDTGQRVRFVTMELVRAMLAEEEPRVAAMLSWLATRLPDLKQVRVSLEDEAVAVDLVFDETYVPQQTIRFVPREQLKPTRH